MPRIFSPRTKSPWISIESFANGFVSGSLSTFLMFVIISGRQNDVILFVDRGGLKKASKGHLIKGDACSPSIGGLKSKAILTRFIYGSPYVAKGSSMLHMNLWASVHGIFCCSQDSSASSVDRSPNFTVINILQIVLACYIHTMYKSCNIIILIVRSLGAHYEV